MATNTTESAAQEAPAQPQRTVAQRRALWSHALRLDRQAQAEVEVVDEVVELIGATI